LFRNFLIARFRVVLKHSRVKTTQFLFGSPGIMLNSIDTCDDVNVLSLIRRLGSNNPLFPSGACYPLSDAVLRLMVFVVSAILRDIRITLLDSCVSRWIMHFLTLFEAI
jgi:hypothetical protein